MNHITRPLLFGTMSSLRSGAADRARGSAILPIVTSREARKAERDRTLAAIALARVRNTHASASNNTSRRVKAKKGSDGASAPRPPINNVEEIDVDNDSDEDNGGDVTNTVAVADRRSASGGRILGVDGDNNDGAVDDEEKSDDNNMDSDDKNSKGSNEDDSKRSNKDEDEDDDEDEEDCWAESIDEQDILANVRLGTDRFDESVEGFRRKSTVNDDDRFDEDVIAVKGYTPCYDNVHKHVEAFRAESAASRAAEAEEKRRQNNSVTLANNSEPAATTTSDNAYVTFFCAASIKYCRCPYEPGTDALTCINCNGLAHEVCTEPLALQTPCELHLALSVDDLEKNAKYRFRKLSPEDKLKVVLCVRCENKLKAIKVQTAAPKKRRSKDGDKVSSQIINELRRLAAFQCQIFVFTQTTNTSKVERDLVAREQFYGNEAKNIKGACNQVIDGDTVYKFLYDVVEGENGVERVLKPMFRGKQQHCAFVAGVDISAAMLGRYANGTGKEMTGRTIWEMGKKVHLMVKKAQSLIRKVGFVQVDSTGWICGYASGRNMQQFHQSIDNGSVTI